MDSYRTTLICILMSLLTEFYGLGRSAGPSGNPASLARARDHKALLILLSLNTRRVLIHVAFAAAAAAASSVISANALLASANLLLARLCDDHRNIITAAPWRLERLAASTTVFSR